MDQITKAMTASELARLEAAKANAAQTEAIEQKPAPEPARLVAKKGKVRSKEVPLEWPVQYDGKVYDNLVVRRPFGSDFRRMADFDPDKAEELQLASMLTEVPIEVIEALDADDYMELQEIVKDFLPRKLKDMAKQLSGTGQSTQQ